MKFLRFRFKQFCVFAMAVMSSFLIGHYIVVPLIKMLPEYATEAVAGGAFAFFLYLCARHIAINCQNEEERQSVSDDVPSTARELADLGVKTPIDFCIAMIPIFTYEIRRPYILSTRLFMECDTEEAWEKAIDLFRAMFGREPARYDEFGIAGWGLYCKLETLKALGREDAENITAQDAMRIISPELIERLGITFEDNSFQFNKEP